MITVYSLSMRGYNLTTHTRTAHLTPSNTHLDSGIQQFGAKQITTTQRQPRRPLEEELEARPTGHQPRSQTKPSRLPELAHVALDYLVNRRAEEDVLLVVVLVEASDALQQGWPRGLGLCCPPGYCLITSTSRWQGGSALPRRRHRGQSDAWP